MSSHPSIAPLLVKTVTGADAMKNDINISDVRGIVSSQNRYPCAIECLVAACQYVIARRVGVGGLGENSKVITGRNQVIKAVFESVNLLLTSMSARVVSTPRVLRSRGFKIGCALVFVSANLAVASNAAVPDINKSLANSVVKVFATRLNPDTGKPWSKQAPTEVAGSGVVIDGNRILTNAHLAQYASEMRIQGNEAGDKMTATVEFIAPAIDLAVLKLDDESFFKCFVSRTCGRVAAQEACQAHDTERVL